MSNLMRRDVPLALSTIIIAFLLFDYYIYTDTTRGLANGLNDWAVLIASEAALIGVINIIIRTYNNYKKKQPYWYLDIWTLVVMAAVGITGLIGVYGTNTAYLWLMNNVYLAVDATVYSMVAFDMVSAFYRTFRVKSKESAVLLVAAALMMVYNAPIFGGLWPQTLVLGSWVLNVPTLAASRAFQYVTAIGIIGFTIRAMLWKEKPMVGVIE